MDERGSRIVLHIGGMDCAACAQTLERAVARLPGVEQAQVSFTSATLIASGTIPKERIAQRIEALGYSVGEQQEILHDNMPSTHARGIGGFAVYLTQTRQRLLIPASAVAVGVMLIGRWTGLPLPEPLYFGINLAAMVLAGYPIVKRGLQSLFLARQITIDLLMSIAAIGALCIGETGEAASVILLFAVGEALEGYTAEQARGSLRSLLALAPQKATVQRACIDCEEHLGQNGYTGGPCPFCGVHETSISIESVHPGDIVVVKPGERIPVDGIVQTGASSVNQAPITGESIPISKLAQDKVFAGTINGEGALEIRTESRPEDSTISRIVRLVEQAQAQRSPTERFVDRFARWYTPAVVLIAAVIATIPPVLFHAPFFDTPDGAHGWLYRALALLIVACPCALVISTPVTVVSSLTSLAQRGILVKGGAFLDSLARLRAIAFDKTGTLTEGKPVIVSARTGECAPDRVDCLCASCNEMLALAAAVESRSEHPLGQAIVAEADARHLGHRYGAAGKVVSLAGKGIQGKLGESVITIGSHSLLHRPDSSCEQFHLQIERAEASGQTVMLIGRDQDLLGFVSVSDQPRRSSQTALRELKSIDSGIRTVMLTGDAPAVAESIAQRVSAVDEIKASLLPEDKAQAIKDLQAEYGLVAMIGDGVNDAPALATANVGIAMGAAGTAQAMETADVVLMQDDLTRLADAIRTSRRTRRIIQQNIVFSLGIKAVFLLLTLTGSATLWMAVLADMGASLLVTLNGMRMLHRGDRPAVEQS